MASFYQNGATRKNWVRGFGSPKGDRLDVIAVRHLDALKMRQIQAMKTTLIANCSEKQAAFWNPTGGRSGLGDMLDEYRRRLLRSEWLMTLRLEDIPDADYRAQVSDYQHRGQGFQLTLVTKELKEGREKQGDWNTPWGGISPGLPFDDTPAPDERPPLGVPWAVWALGGAAAIGAYLYRDRVRKLIK
jgi:hypothetical protein